MEQDPRVAEKSRRRQQLFRVMDGQSSPSERNRNRGAPQVSRLRHVPASILLAYALHITRMLPPGSSLITL